MSSRDKPKTWAERAAAGATAGDHARMGAEVDLPEDRTADRRAEVRTIEQMLALLTWAAGFDRIQRGPLEAEAWLAILGGEKFDEVKAAITAHYRKSRYPVTAADVVEMIEEGIPEW